MSKPWSSAKSRLAKLHLWDMMSSQSQNSVWPWRWWHYDPSECEEPLTQWHSVTFQNTWILFWTYKKTRQIYVLYFAAVSFAITVAEQSYCLQLEEKCVSQHSKFTHRGMQGDNMEHQIQMNEISIHSDSSPECFKCQNVCSATVSLTMQDHPSDLQALSAHWKNTVSNSYKAEHKRRWQCQCLISFISQFKSKTKTSSSSHKKPIYGPLIKMKVVSLWYSVCNRHAICLRYGFWQLWIYTKRSFAFKPWRLRQYIPLKYQHTATWERGAITQKATTWIWQDSRSPLIQ